MNLHAFFQSYPKVALAFSGGCDSAYLLYAARKYNCDIHAYYVKTPFQPKFELEDAQRLADQLQVNMTVLKYDIFKHQDIIENSAKRCYYCKFALFSYLLQTSITDGYDVLLDGTNASDEPDERPGMLALQELHVLSPLRECGITKKQVRSLSNEAGLFTWDKPSYSCLATRIPTGTAIDALTLHRVEKAEAYLMAMGFSDLRVRVLGNAAKLEIPDSQFALVISLKQAINDALSADFEDVFIDLNSR